jgi:hypothetical protein
MVVLPEGVVCVKIPIRGVELAGTVEFAEAGGIKLDALLLTLGVGRGNGERGSSEFDPVEPVDSVMLELALGVMLGGEVIVELEDSVIDPLTVVEFARAEVKTVVMFELGLGDPLGGIVTEAFEDGTIDPLLGSGVELVRGNGVRGASELVPVDTRLVEALALGVDGGTIKVTELETTTAVELVDGTGELRVPTEVVELVDGTGEVALPTGVDELGSGNGVRLAPELVPVDPRLVVTFELGMDGGMTNVIELETTTVVEFRDGAAELMVPTGVVAFEDGAGELALPTGVDELVRGNGLRGASELVPVDPVEAEAMGAVELADGVMIPLFAVADEVYVLPEIVICTISPVEEMSISGVGVTLAGMLVVAFADAGGISPEAPVEVSVYVDPEVEKVSMPDETVIFGKIPEAELGGGMTPDASVEVLTAVEPPMEIISTPEDVITWMLKPGVSVESALLEMFEAEVGTMLDKVVVVVVVDGPDGAVDELVSGKGLRGASEFVPVEPVDCGGTTPSPPVEFAAKVLLRTVKFTLPRETVSTIVTGPLGLGVGGGTMPSPPVEFAVTVLLPTVKFALPTETLSTIVTGAEGVGVGGIIPSPPVEFAVAVLLAIVMFTLPKETVSTTVSTERLGVGGTSPLPLPLIVVAVEPEITIIVEPTDTTSVLFKKTEAGGMTPLPSVEKYVEVPPDTEPL